MSGRRLQLTADGIHLHKLPLLIIKAIDFHLIDAIVHGEHILTIGHPAGAGHMRAEIALRHAAVSLVKYAVHNLTHGAVLVEAQNRGLSVVIAGDKHILVLQVRTQMAAPHAPDGRAVQPRQASVLQDAEGDNPLVRYGVQRLPITGRDHIGGIIHLHLTALLKNALFHVHIVNRDPLGVSRVGIGAYICHIFAFHALFVPPCVSILA